MDNKIQQLKQLINESNNIIYPASGLINYFRGNNLVLINRDSTPYDYRADLVINESLGKVFENII